MTSSAQHRVAVGRYTLSATMAYAVAVWLAGGLLVSAVPLSLAELLQGLWLPFACFLLSVLLMVVLNNTNAHIRIYSRTVSCSFAVLTCAGSFLFGSLSGAAFQVFMIATWLALFRTYQDRNAAGWSYYAFLCVGLASGFFVQILFFAPVLWLLMFLLLSSLSWRTFMASVFGLLTPYWFALPLLFCQDNVEAMRVHFAALADFDSTGVASITINQALLFAFVVGLGLTGSIHCQHKRLDDNIRLRLFYDCFIIVWIVTAVALVLQPQHYDMLIRLMIICVSPLIAHFLTLTNTRITNIAFHVIWITALLLTIFNLWTPSLLF